MVVAFLSGLHFGTATYIKAVKFLCRVYLSHRPSIVADVNSGLPTAEAGQVLSASETLATLCELLLALDAPTRPV